MRPGHSQCVEPLETHPALRPRACLPISPGTPKIWVLPEYSPRLEPSSGERVTSGSGARASWAADIPLPSGPAQLSTEIVPVALAPSEAAGRILPLQTRARVVRGPFLFPGKEEPP